MTIDKKIHVVLEQAVTAPSGDNSQPWWFHLNGNVLEVNMIPDKDNPILNFRLSGSYIALGALIENISILSTEEKLGTKISLLPEKNSPYLIARISFTEDENIEQDELAPFVTKRATNRKPYHKKVLPKEFIDDILSSMNEREGGSIVVLSTDIAVIKATAIASSTMERVALETEAIHKLFFGNIVWSEEEEIARGMGLPIKTTELPPPIQLLFRWIKKWENTKLLNRIGLSKMASAANAQTYATTPVVGVILAKAFEPEAYVEAGRLFERVWIKATRYGLAFQPVTGILFLAQRVFAKETEMLNPQHLPLIESAYNTIKKQFNINEEVPALYFRIGYADKPSANTRRRPPEFR